MRDLADALQSKRDYHGSKNFWFRRGADIVMNELRPLIADLDSLPFPYRDVADYQNVLDQTRGLHRMIFSRGCTFGCPYCSNKALSDLYRNKGRYFRLRSPQKAIEEIQRDCTR